MSIGIGPTGYTPQARFESARGSVGTPAPDSRLGAAVATLEPTDRLELSSTPPAEVRKEVEFAYQRAIDLAANNRELHFATDQETGKIAVQVRDLDGKVIRTIPNTELFDVMSGNKGV